MDRYADAVLLGQLSDLLAAIIPTGAVPTPA